MRNKDNEKIKLKLKNMDKHYKLFIGGINNNNPVYKDYKESPFKSFEEIKKELEKEDLPDKVVIKGGEPTIHPQLFSIISFISDYGCRSLILRTNGRMLNNAIFFNKITKYNNIIYYIDIYGAEESTHDKISNVKGSYKQTIDGIRKISSFDNEINILFPIIPENKNSLLEIMYLLKDHNISNIIFYLPDILATDFFYKEKIYQEFQEQISKLPHHISIQIGFENIPLCLFRNNDYYQQKGIILTKERVYDTRCNKCYKKYWCPGFSSNEFNNIDRAIIKPFTDIKSKIFDIQRKVNQKSVMPIAQEDIYKILYHHNEQKNIWEAIYNLGYPVPLFLLIIEELQDAKLIKIDGNKFKSFVKKKEINKIIDASDERLSSDPKMCQLLVSQDSLKERVGFIADRCLAGGRLAVLGDDDFMSINLASIGLFDEVLVIEIDERIIKKIDSIAKEHNLPITCIQHDLKKSLPKKYLQKFDIVYTDSPHSPDGFLLFISRCIELLKKIPHCHIFSSFSCEMPPIDVELEVQEIIYEMRLFIEQKSMPAKHVIPQFIIDKYDSFDKLKKDVFIDNKSLSELEKWYLAVLGRNEMLFHFLTTTETKSLIHGDWQQEIYYEEHPFDFLMKI